MKKSFARPPARKRLVSWSASRSIASSSSSSSSRPERRVDARIYLFRREWPCNSIEMGVMRRKEGDLVGALHQETIRCAPRDSFEAHLLVRELFAYQNKGHGLDALVIQCFCCEELLLANRITFRITAPRRSQLVGGRQRCATVQPRCITSAALISHNVHASRPSRRVSPPFSDRRSPGHGEPSKHGEYLMQSHLAR